MRSLRMIWTSENGRLVCHWVDSRDREDCGPLSLLTGPERPADRSQTFKILLTPVIAAA